VFTHRERQSAGIQHKGHVGSDACRRGDVTAGRDRHFVPAAAGCVGVCGCRECEAPKSECPGRAGRHGEDLVGLQANRCLESIVEGCCVT